MYMCVLMWICVCSIIKDGCLPWHIGYQQFLPDQFDCLLIQIINQSFGKFDKLLLSAGCVILSAQN